MSEQTSRYKITLMDGTVFEGGRVALADGFLWLWIPGITIKSATDFVFDPEKMGEIRYQHGETENIYEGYTDVLHLMTNPDDISICMVKG